MIVLKYSVISFFLLSIIACSKEEPIRIPEDKSEFFGVWIYKSDEYDNNIKKDNMLLAFYKDSTVSYKRCIKRMNGHKSTIVPEAKLIKLTDKELVIKANLVFMSINLDFEIEKLPYQENNEWFMKVDGALLRRLHKGEKTDHASWECGDKNKDDSEKKQGVNI